MKDNLDTQPPRWAQRLLRWYCRPRLLEDLEGDLNEYFDRNLQTRGATQARLIYVLDVLKFLRPYTVRKPEPLHLYTHTIMLGSYLKTSRRSLVRHKLFSFINVVGLGISMSVGLLMIAMLSDLLSYDDFHEKKDRIYRVITTDRYTDGSGAELATTSLKAGKQIRSYIPGVEAITMLIRDTNGDAQAGDITVTLNALAADASFFTLFTFPLLPGDADTALKKSNSL